MDIRPQLSQFLAQYQYLNVDNLELLAQMYSPDVEFIDPLHRIEGLPALTQYFRGMYQNLQTIQFEYQSPLVQERHASVTWAMHITHTSLNAGQPFTVHGMSALQFNDEGKVLRHRDYFDLAELLYLRLPLLKHIIAAVNRKAGALS